MKIPPLKDAPVHLHPYALHESLPISFRNEIAPEAGPLLGESGADSAAIYPDFATLESWEGFEPALLACIPHLAEPNRPPLGLALALNRHIRDMDPASAAILLIPPDSPIARIATAGNGHRRIYLLTHLAPHEATALPPTESPLHTWIAGTGLFLPDELAPTLGLLFIDSLDLPDRHANWTYVQRFTEAFLPLIQQGGAAVYAGMDQGRFMKTLAVFLPDLEPHAQSAGLFDEFSVDYDGYFGLPSTHSHRYLVLGRSPPAGRTAISRLRAEPDIFCQTWCFTHQFDREIPVVPLDTLTDMRPGQPPCASTILTPSERREISVHKHVRPVDFAWRGYFETSYRAAEIRLTRLSPGFICGAMPWFPLTPDGRAIVGQMGLRKLATERLGALRLQTTDAEMEAKRAAGLPYLTDFRFDRAQFTQMLPVAIGTVETPVLWAYTAWGEHISHFIYEVCPQISLWKRHLRHLGVKVATVVTRPYQWEALRSLGVDDTDVINLACMSGAWKFSDIYFTNGFDDGGYNFTPHMLSFARESSLARPGRPRSLKLYASRTDTPLRRIVNEAALIERLARRGFTILVGTELSLQEKLSLFEQADIVVGACGSNLTFLIAAHPEAAFLEILSAGFYDPFHMRCFNLFGRHYDNFVATLVETVTPGTNDQKCRVDVDALLDRLDGLLARRDAALCAA